MAQRNAIPGLMLVLFALTLSLQAAAPDSAPTESTQRPPEAPVSGKIYDHDLVIVGHDFVLEEHDEARQVTVINGNAILRGTVRRNVTVINGHAQVEGAIQHDLTVIAGRATLGARASVGHNLMLVVSDLDSASTSKISRAKIVFKPDKGFRTARHAVEWFKDGALKARPFPPNHAWCWGLALLSLGLFLLLNTLLPHTVSACADALQARPVGSLICGFLTLTLVSLLLLLLIVSVFGLAVAPFLIAAVTAAAVMGQVALYRLAGQVISRRFSWAASRTSQAALTLGAGLFFVSYTVPVLGFLVWTTVTPLAVGAALLAVASGFRREQAAGRPPQVQVAGATEDSGVLPPVIGSLPADVMMQERAGFWRRLAATLLDYLLFVVLAIVLHKPNGGAILLLWWLYHASFWRWKGATVGGMVLRIRVVRLDNRPMTMGVALVRSVVSLFSALALFLGFFWVGWSREKQSWHDMVAGTTMVKASGKPL